MKHSYNFIDLTGRKFGRLTVIKRSYPNKWGNAMWLCRCKCGREKIIVSNSLRRGNTKSCGCLHKETTIKQIIYRTTRKKPIILTHQISRIINKNPTTLRHQVSRIIKKNPITLIHQVSNIIKKKPTTLIHQ